MSNDPKAVWERYVASWKAESEQEKRALFATSLAEHCTYSDPLQQAVGWEPLLAYMAEFQSQMPGGHFVTESFSNHHGRSMAKWRMVNGDGLKIGEGSSFGEYDAEGRLIAMTGFFETASTGSA